MEWWGMVGHLGAKLSWIKDMEGYQLSCQFRRFFSNNIWYRIGTGDQFLFYLDTWIGNCSLACQFPTLCDHHAKVILLHGPDWWPSVFVAMFRRNLLELEESRLFSYHLLSNFFHGGRCDRNAWMGSYDGSFLSASFFFQLLWEVPHSPVPLTLQFG